MTWKDLPIEAIRPGPSLRTETDSAALYDLGRSLLERGVQEPLRVYPDGAGGYFVETGGRRLAAAEQAGLGELPCQILPAEPGEADRIADQLTADLQREDLPPLDRARGMARLREIMGWSQRELADYLAVSQATVSQSLALLGLAPDAQALVEAGQLAPSTAIRLADLPEDDQGEEAQLIVAGRVPRAKVGPKKKPKPERAVFSLVTPGKWQVEATAPRKRASMAQLIEELAGLVSRLREPAPESEAA